MATVLGDSGAWSDIARSAAQRGCGLRSPDDIEARLKQLRDSYEPAVRQRRSETEAAIEAKKSRINELRLDRGFVRRLINWFKIQLREAEIDELREAERSYIGRLSSNIGWVERLPGSPELAGARAELAVIEQLRRLPAENTVLNDVQLRATRFIQFNGIPLQSAQIDHLVLSPAGVFAIETKLWSRQFAESGRYHDPFDQIQRAGYLCFDLLREQFGKIHVRQIIACAGSLPPAPEGAHVKVLPIGQLNGYITWFKERALVPGEIVRVQEFLGQFLVH